MNYKKIERVVNGYSIEVGYDSVEKYGYFEIYDEESGGENYHAEGGLWTDNSNALVDYDGVYELDKDVIKIAEELEINMDYAK